MFAARNMMFARSSAFNPLSLSPALWLDASDASTLLDAGGSPAAPDEAIATWSDKSDNGRHATQSTLANRPLRKTSVQNGKDVVRFDGSNDFLTATVAANRDTFTVFAVFDKISGDASTFRIGVGFGNGGQGTFWAGHFQTTAQRSVSMSYVPNDIKTTASNAMTMYCGIVNGPASRSVSAYFNGVFAGSASQSVIQRPADAFCVGGYFNGSFPINSNVCEILVFPTALSTADRQQVENYLNAKWAIY